MSTALLLCLLSAGSASPVKPEPAEPLPVALVGADEESEKGWLPRRLIQLAGKDLARAGLLLADPRFLGTRQAPTPERLRTHGWSAWATLKLRPARVADPTEPLELKLSILTADGKKSEQTLAATAEELDRLAVQLAQKIAEQLQRPFPQALLQRLERERQPFVLQRNLGEAWLELDSGDPRRARMKFDRAGELNKFSVVPEALLGASLAEANAASSLQGKGELAASALERAEHELRQKPTKEGIQALLSFLRYTPDRALRFLQPIPLGNGFKSRVISGDQDWLIQRDEGELWSLDPRSGALRGPEAAVPGLFAMIGEHRLSLNRLELTRAPKSGPLRWKLRLPFAPRNPSLELIPSGGLLPILGEHAVAWIDLSLGSVGQIAEGVEPLALGGEGVLIRRAGKKGKELGLLRPGKKTAAWTVEEPADTLAAVLVPGRVMLLGAEGLRVLDALNGKARSGLLNTGAGARLVGADGRFLVLAFADGTLHSYDVLAGTAAASLSGPGPAVGALATSTGLAVVFESGDLIAYDRDGLMLDRVRVPGVPFELRRGHALAPGPVVLSSQGLFAFGEVPEASNSRDVDQILRLASALDEVGERETALDLLELWLIRPTGRVAELESLRARLLSKAGDPASKAAAASALARAARVKDLHQPLPRYRFVD